MALLFNESPKYLLTSESVTEGHPDKLCDQISDGVLDAVLKNDPMGRVACETCVTNGLVVTLGQTQYYAFGLDINESNADARQLLSLDEVRIFTSSVAGQTSTDLNSLGTIRYRLDSHSGIPNSDHRVVLDSSNTHGSGQSDMTMLVPVSRFSGASPNDYVVLYSQFGLNNSSTAGFEEWSAAVPEPGTAGLALLGAAAFLGRRRRRCA